jgi:hypothetical protein
VKTAREQKNRGINQEDGGQAEPSLNKKVENGRVAKDSTATTTTTTAAAAVNNGTGSNNAIEEIERIRTRLMNNTFANNKKQRRKSNF